MWDVDGSGLSKIEDPDIAQAILRKVNDMNAETLVKVAVPVTAFALLPKPIASMLVFFAALYAGLYFLQGKIPEP